jgi:restriction endonuclease S subunit
LTKETLSTAEELVSTHEKTIETLTAEKETAVEALQNANVEALNEEISALKTKVSKLEAGAGAETATSIPNGDASGTGAKSSYDTLNEALAAAETPGERKRLMAEFKKNNSK